MKSAASEIDAAGGVGINVICDHSDDQQVQGLFDRIHRERGRLDLLVNSAAAVHAAELAKPGGYTSYVT